MKMVWGFDVSDSQRNVASDRASSNSGACRRQKGVLLPEALLRVGRRGSPRRPTVLARVQSDIQHDLQQHEDDQQGNG